MFNTDLALRERPKRRWKTIEELVWTGSQGDTFTVPAGFETDLTTVPRFLHWLTLPYGAYTRAAVLHDWLLWLLAEARRNGTVPAVTSRDADGIFRAVMRELEVPWSKRWVMWAAVRAAACFNADRAYGRDFHKDAPKVIGLAILTAPIILPGVVGVLLSLGMVRIINLFRR